MVQAQGVNHPANSFYVYEQVYDQQGNPIEGLYVDRNGDGVINDEDRYFCTINTWEATSVTSVKIKPSR